MHGKALRLISAVIVPVLVFSCASLATAALVRYFIAPRLAHLSSQRAQAAWYKRLVSEKDQNQALIGILLGKKQELAKKIDQSKIPQQSAADLPSLLQLLISKAKEADIRFVKMEPQADAARPRDGSYPVILEMTTSFASLGRFVSSLERLPHVLRIDRLAVTEEKTGLDVRILVTCSLEKGD
jgi:Tfp pilus assembly protein PilO